MLGKGCAHCSSALAIAAGAAVMSLALVDHAVAQCQTWAFTPQFNDLHVGGNWISAFQVFDDGSGSVLWVGGDFGSNPSNYEVSRWNGQTWLSTPGLNDEVSAFAVYNDGTGAALYAGGNFSQGSLGRAVVH
jgi:hypothetical protein